MAIVHILHESVFMEYNGELIVVCMCFPAAVFRYSLPVFNFLDPLQHYTLGTNSSWLKPHVV